MEFKETKYKICDKYIQSIKRYLKIVTFPGFEKVPAYYVLKFFIKGLTKGSINTRASSIAFNFTLAIGPAIIFLLTLVPYLSINSTEEGLLKFISDIMPSISYDFMVNTMGELTEKRQGLRIFGFLVAGFFSVKGVLSMIVAFNATYHTIETRSWIQQLLISAFLVLLFTFLVSISIGLMIGNNLLVAKLVEMNMITASITYIVLLTGKWSILILLILIGVSSMYYMAPQRKTKWRFFSTGSILATCLIFVISLIFTFFVNHFAQFNKFFGSIGALIALMLWFNFMSFSLLIGFELNASIKHAQSNNEHEK